MSDTNMLPVDFANDDIPSAPYVLQVRDTESPRHYYLIGPFDDWAAASDWAKAYEDDDNLSWQIVDVMGDPRQPMRVVLPAEEAKTRHP